MSAHSQEPGGFFHGHPQPQQNVVAAVATATPSHQTQPYQKQPPRQQDASPFADSPRFSSGSPVPNSNSDYPSSSSWQEGHIFGFDGHADSVGFQDSELDVLNESEDMKRVRARRGRASREEAKETSAFSSFTECIERILKKHATREEAHQVDESTLFTSSELAELALLCTQQVAMDPSASSSSAEGFAGVEGDLLTSLSLILQKHVQGAESVDLFQEAAKVYHTHGMSTNALQKWLVQEAHNRLQELRLGLEAGNIVLQIAVTEGIDRRVVNEDFLQGIITLFRFHMRVHVVPTLNQTAHLVFRSPEEKQKANLAPSPGRKRKRSSSTPQEALDHLHVQELGKLYKFVVSTFQVFFVMMDRLELLMKSMLLDDQQVLLLTNAAFQTFEIDCQPNKQGVVSPGYQMQISSIAILSAAVGQYPSHRDTILEDVWPILLRIPTAKRSLRVFRVRYASASSSSFPHLNNSIMKKFWEQGGNHCIQMMTALFLSLVQSCVMCPSYKSKDSENEVQPEGEFESGLVSCQQISSLLVFELLKRCKRSKYGGASDEYRGFLSNLVQDLLSVLLIPEYPASEMLLSALLVHLRYDIQQASKSGTKASATSGTENSYLSVAFDILGKIFAVEAQLLKVHGDCPIEIRTGRAAPDKDGDEIEISCYCGRQDRDSFLLGCDICKVFFHGKCVGQSSEIVPDEWICDSCRLGRISKREQGVKECDDAVVDRPYVLRHAFLSSLAHRKGVENISRAVEFHFAQWLGDLHAKASKTPENKQTKRVLGELVNQWASIEPNGEPLTDEGYNRMLLALFAEASPLARSFRKQLSFVLNMMEDRQSPHLRKLSLKTIERAAEGDDKLMLIPAITGKVSGRLTDETISVREAALSFVGHYVISFPRVACAFQSSLITCLSDTGVSVRKRAVRIFQEVLLTSPHYKGRSEACDAMLRRVADSKEEDTVRDLIYDLFTRLWLQDGDEIVAGPSPAPRKDPPSVSPMQAASATSPISTVVIPTQCTPSRSRSKLKRVDLAAEQMMEVVRASGGGDHLEKLLKHLFHTKIDDDRKRNDSNPIETSRQHLDSLIAASFDLLLSLEENRAHRGANVGEDIAATLRTIEVLSGTAPSSALNHIDTILPYLKADNGVSMENESMIVSACCDILTRASSICNRSDLNRVASASVVGDLKQIIYKFGPEGLNSAIRALSAFAHHPESDGQVCNDLLGLAQTFYAYLLRHKNTADFSPGKLQEKVRCNLFRALAVLGLICLHRGRQIVSAPILDDDQFDLPVGDIPPSSSLSWSNLTMSCYQVFAEYLEKKDAGTKCAALRALGSVFMSEPRLLFALEQVGLIEDIMSPKAPLSLQMEALDCWKRILESEEKRIDAGQANDEMDRDASITVTKRISGDQDGDSNLFGGILTSHADRLFEMVCSKDIELRLSALELLGLLLRQGLVNPNDAVPFLLALQGDVENDSIRSLALEFLIAEGQKRPDMLRQRVCAGVKQACAFQRSVYPQRQQVCALIETESGVECVFDKVFRECIAPIRKQREGLYSSLLGLFESKDLSHSPTSASSSRKFSTRGRDGATTDLALLTFVAEVLAHLPYTTAIDPLFIIHKIGSIAASQGYQILDNFASLLRPLRLDGGSDEWDDTNEDEDVLEKCAKEKFPCRTKHAGPLTSGNFDLKSFSKQCQRSGGFVLLMRLRAYLRHVYKLSEIRCFEFNPNDKEKLSDKGIFKIARPPRFDSKLPVVSAAKLSKNPFDVNALIRQYALFRQSFRAEMASSINAQDEQMEKEVKFRTETEQQETPVPVENSSQVES